MATRDAAHRTGAITFFGFGLVVAAVLFTSRAAQAGTWIPAWAVFTPVNRIRAAFHRQHCPIQMLTE